MRLPRFRLKLWMLVVAVTVAGLLIGGEALRRRRNRYVKLADQAARSEQVDREWASFLEREVEELQEKASAARRQGDERGARFWEQVSGDRAQVASLYAQAATILADRRIKYERAARYPWLSFAPGPPLPGEAQP